MGDFFAANKRDWDELERLTHKARRWTVRLTTDEAARLDVLYRRAAVHAAQATTQTNDERLIHYLNSLVAQAHSVIYSPPRKSKAQSALQFFCFGFARTIARQWRYHAVSAALMIFGGLLAFFAGQHDPLALYAILPAGDTRVPGSSRDQLLSYLRHGRDGSVSSGFKFMFASFLFSHNLKVSILAMGTGLLAGVPTAVLMVYNGMILGAFVCVHYQAGIDADMWAWILPHGITELGAIVLCGGVGLMLGKAIVSPGQLSSSESLRLAGIEAGRICIGVTAMLIFAAIIESYLRQSRWSTEARLAFASATAVFWILYIAQGFYWERVESHTRKIMEIESAESPGASAASSQQIAAT